MVPYPAHAADNIWKLKPLIHESSEDITMATIEQDPLLAQGADGGGGGGGEEGSVIPPPERPPGMVEVVTARAPARR